MRNYMRILIATVCIAMCTTSAIAQKASSLDGFKVLFSDYVARLKKSRTTTNASPLNDALPFVLSLTSDGGAPLLKLLAAAA